MFLKIGIYSMASHQSFWASGGREGLWVNRSGKLPWNGHFMFLQHLRSSRLTFTFGKGRESNEKVYNVQCLSPRLGSAPYHVFQIFMRWGGQYTKNGKNLIFCQTRGRGSRFSKQKSQIKKNRQLAMLVTQIRLRQISFSKCRCKERETWKTCLRIFAEQVPSIPLDAGDFFLLYKHPL